MDNSGINWIFNNADLRYYTPDQYERLVALKNEFDPVPTVFTPNNFCVGAPKGEEMFAPMNGPQLEPAQAFQATSALASWPSKMIHFLHLDQLANLKMPKLRSSLSTILKHHPAPAQRVEKTRELEAVEAPAPSKNLVGIFFKYFLCTFFINTYLY